jgi:hypothetical protein
MRSRTTSKSASTKSSKKKSKTFADTDVSVLQELVRDDFHLLLSP